MLPELSGFAEILRYDINERGFARIVAAFSDTRTWGDQKIKSAGTRQLSLSREHSTRLVKAIEKNGNTAEGMLFNFVAAASTEDTRFGVKNTYNVTEIQFPIDEVMTQAVINKEVILRGTAQIIEVANLDNGSIDVVVKSKEKRGKREKDKRVCVRRITFGGHSAQEIAAHGQTLVGNHLSFAAKARTIKTNRQGEALTKPLQSYLSLRYDILWSKKEP